MSAQNTTGIFNFLTILGGYEELNAQIQARNAKKRGNYNVHTKPPQYSPYKHIQALYTQLAGYISICPFLMEDAVFRYNEIKIWVSYYKAGKYIYNGKIYEGQNFHIIQAEIRGTENFNVKHRIYLHQKLINFLRNGMDLKDALILIKKDVKKIRRNYKLTEYAQWLKKQRKI